MRDHLTQNTMKTSRLIMIATVLSITIASFSVVNVLKADPPIYKKNVIELTFEEAIEDHGLATAMNIQLGKEFLNNEFPVYTAEVTYAGYLFRISGTYNQWNWFFQRGWKLVSSSNQNNS